jgi:hypothetical protein
VVAFDGDEEIRTVFLQGLPQGLLRGMEGVEHEQLAVERAEFFQQLSNSFPTAFQQLSNSFPTAFQQLSNSFRAAGISLLLCSTATMPNTRPESWLWALTNWACCQSSARRSQQRVSTRLARLGQDQVCGVVSDEREAAATLGDIPAEPSLAILEVVGRSAPTQQSDPPAIHLGDIAELLANQSVALEVVRLSHQLAETRTQQGVREG